MHRTTTILCFTVLAIGVTLLFLRPTCAQQAAETVKTPEAPKTIRLTSKRLTIDIDAPGASYRRSRFDWTGFITQVTLDRRNTFCTYESTVPGRGTGGVGLCNEFGLVNQIGNEDTEVGQQFPKIGVGLLTRFSPRPHGVSMAYPVQPFAMSYTADASSVTFTVEPAPCRGYAVRYRKTISVRDNHLTISYTLENVGEKPIVTEEYCHNFLSINGNLYGPDYVMRFTSPIASDTLSEPLTLVNTHEIRWAKTPERAFNNAWDKFIVNGLPQWELLHEPSGVGVREISTFPTTRFALYGTGHCICPETFFDINLPPGETVTWQREYEFFGPRDRVKD